MTTPCVGADDGSADANNTQHLFSAMRVVQPVANNCTHKTKVADLMGRQMRNDFCSVGMFARVRPIVATATRIPWRYSDDDDVADDNEGDDDTPMQLCTVNHMV